MSGVVVRLSQFEGPLDLLLHLVARAQVDIRDIFVSHITEQYLQAVQQAGDFDMDAASEFLSMAALLIEIKSRALLPRPPAPEEEGESPEEALVRRLTEYKRFKDACEELRFLEQGASAHFYKLPEERPPAAAEVLLDDMTLSRLTRAFAKLLMRVPPEDAPEPVHTIAREAVTVPQSMAHIVGLVRRGPVHFAQLFSGTPSREEIVTVFLALLELLRQERVSVDQQDVFGEIVVRARKGERIKPLSAEDWVDDDER